MLTDAEAQAVLDRLMHLTREDAIDLLTHIDKQAQEIARLKALLAEVECSTCKGAGGFCACGEDLCAHASPLKGGRQCSTCWGLGRRFSEFVEATPASTGEASRWHFRDPHTLAVNCDLWESDTNSATTDNWKHVTCPRCR